MAHNSVLLLNELPEFKRSVLEVMRQPLEDRIDIHIEINTVPFEKLSSTQLAEPSTDIRKRVTAARKQQTKRLENSETVHYNAQMNVKHIRIFCKLSATSLSLLKTAMEKLKLSARSYDRTLKTARTIAELEDE